MMAFTPSNTFIGKLKSLSSDSSVKSIFDLYRFDKPNSWNINTIGRQPSIKKEFLESAIQLLLSDPVALEFPVLVAKLKSQCTTATTKIDITSCIVSFLHDTSEAPCAACSHIYVPHATDNDGAEFKCFQCDRPSHKGCLTGRSIEPELGLIYLCGICLPQVKKSDNQNPADPPDLNKGSQQAEPDPPADPTRKRKIKRRRKTKGPRRSQRQRQSQRQSTDFRDKDKRAWTEARLERFKRGGQSHSPQCQPAPQKAS